MSGVLREAKQLDAKPSTWLVYNQFNELLHNSKREFSNAYALDRKIFDFNMELALLNN